MFLTFDIMPVASVLFLVFLEGALSLDNALVLALVVKHLPPPLQKKALTYGIAGAFAFRFIALILLRHLLTLVWLKLVAALYLIYIGVGGLIGEESEISPDYPAHSFIRTVVSIELIDIAFSMDSVFAAVAVSDSFWVVFTGGVLGIIMMRYAASVFASLIDRFPRLIPLAYILVCFIGAKLGAEGVMKLWLNI